MPNGNVSFSPLGAAVAVSATASSVGGSLPGVGGDACRVVNTSATLQVAVAMATADQAAPTAAFNAANSVILEPNEARALAMPYNATQVAAIGSGAGPTTVYFQRGSGGQ